MTSEDLRTRLYQKMSAEQEQYRDWLLGQPPGEILNHAAEYSTREHDSLKISNGKWHWFSRGIGGRLALDYNALFAGYDGTGAMRYATLRGTLGDFKGEVEGSDKRYSLFSREYPLLLLLRG